MKKLHVCTAAPYDILIEKGILNRTGEFARGVTNAERAAIITDTNVGPLYAETVQASLKNSGFLTSVFTFKAGESSKRLSTIEQIYSHLAQNNITRSDIIIALGGGVTGDMAGFAAASWLRGIPFIQVPTSLLAQIDSSVGGKTGVDLPEGKNLVGAFWQPEAVIIDPETLQTLPERYFSDGMAEAVKYGCIKSKPLFDRMKKENAADFIEDMIYACVDIKRKVVEQDERESGERMLLNFGHTFGHALEKFCNYTAISHGEAVGIGMLMVLKAGEKAGLTAPHCYECVKGLLQKYSLPVHTDAPVETLCINAGMDKKRTGSAISLILLEDIGKSFIQKIQQNQLLDFMNGKDG